MKYITLLLIPLLLIQCNRPNIVKSDHSLLKRTKDIISLVDSSNRVDSINTVYTLDKIDSLKNEIELYKNRYERTKFVLDRERIVYQRMLDRKDFKIDSLQRRVDSFTFLTIRKNEAPLKYTLMKKDTIE